MAEAEIAIATDRLVTLADGQVVSLDTVGLLMDLVSAGYRVYLASDIPDDLMIGTKSKLTPALVAEVEEHREELVRLLQNVDPIQ